MTFALDFTLKTHPGLVRPLNEDAVGADPGVGLFLLADGLGGYNAGETASTMAVSTLLADLTAALRRARTEGIDFDPRRVLHDALVEMNQAIYRAALNSAAFQGMATTIVVAWFLGESLWVAHTGDSRLYRLRGGELAQITRDHSFSQELLDAGMVTEEEARLLPAKNLVTRALGAGAEVEPEVHEYDVAEGRWAAGRIGPPGVGNRPRGQRCFAATAENVMAPTDGAVQPLGDATGKLCLDWS